MKIVNGKLLGQPCSDLDIFKESQNKQNLKVNKSLQQLDLRICQTENSLKGDALRDALFRNLEASVQKLEARCDLLEREHKRLKKIEQRWEYMENTKLSQIENNLLKVKQLIPHKLLWLTFSSSLVLGTISLYSWLNIFSSEQRPKEVSSNYFLSQGDLVHGKTRSIELN